MEKGVIPGFPTISILAGPAGSGKTNLAAFLLTRPEFYGKSYEGMRIKNRHGEVYKLLEPKPYFDQVILLIGSTDDMYDQLVEDGVVSMKIYQPTKEDVAHIIKEQEDIIARDGILKAPKLLIVCDDILGDRSLMASQAFRTLSTKNRHLNASIWYLSQYIKFVPKGIREQASTFMCFRPTAECVEVLEEILREPKMDKKAFRAILLEATRNDSLEEKNFLYCDKKAVSAQRYRKNLDTFLAGAEENLASIQLDKKLVKKEYKNAESKEDPNEPESQPNVDHFKFGGIDPQVIHPSEKYGVDVEAKKKLYVMGGKRIYK